MFNVGDTITTGVHEYTVDEVVPGDRVNVGDRVVVRDSTGMLMSGYHSVSIFTLVTPATPVLTGMTQFFKDKEKSNVT